VNVTTKNLFDEIRDAMLINTKDGRLFDVITCDPPWQLSSANPTRGVAIAYSTLKDDDIMQLPLEKI
jgi:mRNA (2'-O-methyladenosine-N6-)-methyltransferase